MLEIKKANKVFNKGRKNRIHAINNTTLTLPETGLVALLGPSGCGKTTLLNAIGGLDNLRSGAIYLNGKKMNSFFTSQTDKLRNINIGYIFQDYKLVEKLSVYDNVALTLKMIGIKDKEEIKKRVEYVLDRVGMLRYKKRPANTLSGGQRQRVGIARALAKNPRVILADEPTGNLDSKNSLEIMKIIKALSKDCLVILVTHEQSLAKFYASRIIEIKDGTVEKDYENDHTDNLDYQIDNTIYLKDFASLEQIKENNHTINIYSNNEEKVNIDIVISEGNIYLRSNTPDKLEVIDETSSIELLDEHYKTIAKEDIDNYKFDFNEMINKDIKKKYSSIFNPISLLVKGFEKVFDYPILKKILLLGFFASGMFLMYAISTIAASLTVNDEDFVKYNKSYLTLEQKNISVSEYLAIEGLPDITYMLPGDSTINLNILYNDYYQTVNNDETLKGSLSSLNLLTEKDLLYGTMPKTPNELVVDKLSITKMFKSNKAKMAGINNEKDLLNRKAKLQNELEFTIVGITDLKSPSIYVKNEMFIPMLSSNNPSSDYEYGTTSVEDFSNDNLFADYNLYASKISLVKGRLPQNDYETIVNLDNEYSMPLNKEISTKINNQKLKVVGYYTSRENYNYYFVNTNTIKYNLILHSSNATIYAKDKEKAISVLQEKKLNVKDSYEKSRADYLKAKKESTNSTILVSGIIICISLIEILLMVRSSFLSRIKEVGIYRAIGVKKFDIYKMFFGEIFAITTIASVPGLLLMAYFLKVLSEIKILASVFTINIYLILLAIIFVYIFNLLVGLLPVFNTIRKTPAQILARHDIQ